MNTDTKEEVPTTTLKQCFVIGPIGREGDSVRDEADWVLEYIIKPAAVPLGYEVVRADKVAGPGLISHDVVNRAMESDLVIADLTGHNANAFYELGLAHAATIPVIHMFKDGEELPFDVKDYRSVPYRLANPSDVEVAKDLLAKHIKEVEKPGFQVSNPVTTARGLKNLATSADPMEQIIAAHRDELSELKSRITQLENKQQGEIRKSPRTVLSKVVAREQIDPIISSEISAIDKLLEAETSNQKRLQEITAKSEASLAGFKEALESANNFSAILNDISNRAEVFRKAIESRVETFDDQEDKNKQK